MTEPDKLLYSLKEAAAKVSMSEKTLRREYQANNLVIREKGGRYYVEHDELLRWVQSLDAPAPRSA